MSRRRRTKKDTSRTNYSVAISGQIEISLLNAGSRKLTLEVHDNSYNIRNIIFSLG